VHGNGLFVDGNSLGFAALFVAACLLVY